MISDATPVRDEHGAPWCSTEQCRLFERDPDPQALKCEGVCQATRFVVTPSRMCAPAVRADVARLREMQQRAIALRDDKLSDVTPERERVARGVRLACEYILGEAKPSEPAIYDCGCSRHKVALGLCDLNPAPGEVQS